MIRLKSRSVEFLIFMNKTTPLNVYPFILLHSNTKTRLHFTGT